MKDYKAISEKAVELIEYQKKLIYQHDLQPNSLGKAWRERVEGLEVIIDTFTKQLSELKVLEQPEVNTDSENKEDLKQYITNLLYYVHIEANSLTSSEFDKWAEENIKLIEDYDKKRT